MSISGLVVTLVDDKERADRAIAAITAAGPFTVGVPIDLRLPLALDAADAQEAHRWHDWLTELDGVVKVDIAFVAD